MGGIIPSEAKENGQKIFESWETIALYSDSHRGKNNKVSQAKYISIWHVNFLLRILYCQYQTTFTMESLILAQDER